MKLAVIVLLASLSLFTLCSSLDDDYQEPVGDVDEGEPERQARRGRVSEDDTVHDSTIDQEALLGGKAARRRLTEMSNEEALKEIRKLVERIDTDKDGQLDRSELFAWLSKVEDKVILEETASVFDKEDTDDDGYITIEEYMSNSGIPDDYIENEEVEPMQEGLQERFNVADLDKDGRLSKEEFEMFVHPDRHKEMMQHLVGEQLTRFDTDKDGKISFEEYMKYYNPAGKSMDEMPEWIVNEQREFEAKLDVNRDGFLDGSEIEGWISPSDEEFINEEVEHLLNDIDENKDEKLSYEEVLDKFDVLVESPLTDYGHTVHEEL